MMEQEDPRLSLGLYVASVSNRPRPFGEQTRMLMDLTRLGASRGVDVLVLTPGFCSERVAWTFDLKNKSWKMARGTPLPDVVLRRVSRFRSTSMKVASRDLELFRSTERLHTLPLICSNKWHLYRMLRRVSDLRAYLPHAQLASSAVDVLAMVKDRQDVYVKPLSGTWGNSIHRLQFIDGQVVATWEESTNASPSRSRRGLFRPVKSIRQQILADAADFHAFWAKTRLKRCLVQDTVNLPRTYSGEPFDFRWLVQACSKLRIVARVARIGQVQGITTNIHTGGRPMEAEEAIASIDPAIRPLEMDATLQELDDVALTVARTLRDRYGDFAELGVDMSLRTDGGVALFEVNPTPGRRMLRALDGNPRELSLLCLIEYVIRATGCGDSR